MKEIKFRAWDKIAKEMREIEGIDFQYQVIGYLLDEDFGSLEFSEIELMQYSGLKDKNGVEIYEGDTVRYDETVYVVEFINQSYEPLCYYNNAKVEVIGNIYEHPELLKESK